MEDDLKLDLRIFHHVNSLFVSPDAIAVVKKGETRML